MEHLYQPEAVHEKPSLYLFCLNNASPTPLEPHNLQPRALLMLQSEELDGGLYESGTHVKAPHPSILIYGLDGTFCLLVHDLKNLPFQVLILIYEQFALVGQSHRLFP